MELLAYGKVSRRFPASANHSFRGPSGDGHPANRGKTTGTLPSHTSTNLCTAQSWCPSQGQVIRARTDLRDNLRLLRLSSVVPPCHAVQQQYHLKDIAWGTSVVPIRLLKIDDYIDISHEYDPSDLRYIFAATCPSGRAHISVGTRFCTQTAPHTGLLNESNIFRSDTRRPAKPSLT